MKTILVALALVLSAPAAADGSLLEDGEEEVERLLSLLETLVESIPLYGMPEVLDNGDIILRRIQPDDDAAQPPADSDGKDI